MTFAILCRPLTTPCVSFSHSSPLHCMSHQSLDRTATPVRIQSMVCRASAHGRCCTGRSPFWTVIAVCTSLRHVNSGMEEGALASRQYCAGTRLPAKSACGGTRLKPRLRPKGATYLPLLAHYTRRLHCNNVCSGAAKELAPIGGLGCRCSSPIARWASTVCIETTTAVSPTRPMYEERERDPQGSATTCLGWQFG